MNPNGFEIYSKLVHRNYRELGAVLLTAKDEYHDRLVVAFPEFFTDDPQLLNFDTIQGLASIYYDFTRIGRNSRCSGGDEVNNQWGDILPYLGIPTTQFAVGEEDDLPVPEEVKQQLIGKRYQFLENEFTWRGERWVICWTTIDVGEQIEEHQLEYFRCVSTRNLGWKTSNNSPTENYSIPVEWGG